MDEYTDKVMDHFHNPRNVGQFGDPDGVGKVGNPVCGDLMEIQIEVKDDQIEDVKFRTFGCGAAVATSSMVTKMAMGKTLEEASRITRNDVAAELGGLPAVKMHCSNLAADALHAAIDDYHNRLEGGGNGDDGEYDYDVAIIGGGPGGLSAASQCAKKGLKTVIFEADTWGGIPGRLCPEKNIEHYPGLPEGTTGGELSKILHKETELAGVESRPERVDSISPEKVIKTSSGEYSSRTIVLATGSTPNAVNVPGEQKYSLNGGGVHYSVVTPSELTGKRVIVVGGGDSAIAAASTLIEYAGRITLAHRGPDFRAKTSTFKSVLHSDKVKTLMNTELVEICGGKVVERVVLRDLTEDERFEMVADAVILAVGMKPATEIYRELGVELDNRGYVKTDRSLKTNVEGVFAIGDLVSDLELIVVAVAHGAIVAHQAHVGLRRPYWAKN